MYLNLELFKRGRTSLNSLNVFMMTLAGCNIGAHARISNLDLSVFWPVNIIIAVLFYRCRYLNTPWFYGVSYAAMVLQDALFYGWGVNAFTINSANIIFIFVLNQLLNWPSFTSRRETDMTSSLYVFVSCMLAAIACGVAGALAQQPWPNFSQPLFRGYFLDWFSDQFYTSVLFLPLLFTLQSRIALKIPTVQWLDTLPLLMLILSVCVAPLFGPVAILAFPLPALTWCAIVYPLWLIRLITLCTGATELILCAEHMHAIYSAQDPYFMHHITIMRIGIAATIFSPLMMATNARTIRQLNARLLQQASHDFLTKTLSRYGFTEALTAHGHRATASQHTVNIMLIDIDYFKRINDNFGHECGDEILRQVAGVIKQTVAEQGLVSRIGGEEFVVVCFDYSPGAFYQLADRLRQHIQQTTFLFYHQAVPVTVSIGIAHAPSPGQPLVETVHQLFPLADKNLYTAKREGRNRTVQ
ncbi:MULTISPECIES: GGDEF domain-containing protein [Dickeya]|uniref:diguanylate cyclase n=1 Tax=Dickeya aquatica TaxID=1401087 RepID=A0A375A901_9GAMM|nr:MULTISPECIES: GGDEF domain-containing protein [Dickeya]SLM62513.1 diguanylate cyclase/phosphodiesterase (GGDEF & EAL domains) with PAS/PAC sensor(s) [Dickeya aquatica]